MKTQVLQQITPNLWFDTQAEEAVNFYLSVFKNSRMGRVSRFGKAGHEIHGMPEGLVMQIEFELNGQQFLALNGGPYFKFTEAISFVINCETQGEIDDYWARLTAGGDPAAQQCGWLKDKYGLSWQVVPTLLADLMLDDDKTKADKVMTAMLQMKKIDIAKLEEAYNS